MAGVLSRAYSVGGPSSANRGVTTGLYNPAQPSDPITDAYKLKDASTQQQAGDYDSIMGGYRNLIGNLSSMPAIQAGSYNPSRFQYQQSGESKNALNNLRGLSETGGYSPGDIANIRARNLSPIRSIYANANREVDRSRRLSGGFAPNYSAVKSKMARELSEKLGEQLVNTNASIAQNVAGNKLSIAPTYASAASRESDAANQAEAQNTQNANEASKFNLQFPLQVGEYNRGTQSQIGNALGGMQSLYGTTPALSRLFGDQALSAASLQNNINNQRANSGIDFVRSVLGRA